MKAISWILIIVGLILSLSGAMILIGIPLLVIGVFLLFYPFFSIGLILGFLLALINVDPFSKMDGKIFLYFQYMSIGGILFSFLGFVGRLYWAKINKNENNEIIIQQVLNLNLQGKIDSDLWEIPVYELQNRNEININVWNASLEEAFGNKKVAESIYIKKRIEELRT